MIVLWVVEESTHPRKGTETNTVFSSYCFPRNQLIPARGRKQRRSHASNMIAGESTHPRKGTETALTAGTSYCLSRANQLIPARGRKRILLRTVPPPFENQLIPARGRKLRLPTVSLSSSMNQLIPARGRKRPINCSTCFGCKRINSSPQGDGNIFLFVFCLCFYESTHPRKGTETIFYHSP